MTHRKKKSKDRIGVQSRFIWRRRVATHNLKILGPLVLILILESTHCGFISGFGEGALGNRTTPSLEGKSTRLFELEPEFHTYTEVVSELAQIESDHPSIGRVFSLGTSYEGRNILGMKISDNVETEESEPEVFICALHHAREAATVEVAMYIINYLTDHYGKPGHGYTTYLVDNREIYIVPIVNPDGKVYDDSGGQFGSGMYWRKTRQTCSGGIGIDLNRNYSYQWGGLDSSGCCADPQIFRGYSPFDAPETAAIRDFVLSHPDITVFLDYHSFGGMVLWPWGYTQNPISDLDDRQVHEIIGREYAEITGYRPMKVSDLYCCSGISIDWTYGITKDDDVPIFSFGIELWGRGDSPGAAFYPPPSMLPAICESNCEAALYMIEMADDPYKVLHQWKVTDFADCNGPERGGNAWYALEYDDSLWKTVYLPGYTPEPCENCYQFYRRTLQVYHETQQVFIDVGGCDDVTLYINEHCVDQWGYSCRREECVKRPNTLYTTEPVERIDITDYVHVGTNTIAVCVSNTLRSDFEVRITQSTEMYDDKMWKATYPGPDCSGPGNGGNAWYSLRYDDSDWTYVMLPDENAWGCHACDRFYRRTITVPDYTPVLLDFASCDSITVYVNEQYVGHWGGECHQEGGVNALHCTSESLDPIDITKYVHQGENLIAVHVSTKSRPYFDMTILRPKILPDLRMTNQDISFSTPAPDPYERVTIYATVHNTGMPIPSAVLLQVYDGHPKRGTLIHESSVEITAASQTFNTAWVYPGGVHDIYVVVDEDDTIPEPDNETNNTGHAFLPVPDWNTWPMFRHDIYHSGISRLKGTITTPVEKWRFTARGPVRSSPSVGDINEDGKMEIVFGSDDHHFYALTHTGEVLWTVETGGSITSSASIADINNDGNAEIVFGSDDGSIYALVGKDGSLLWKYFTGAKVDSSPLCYDIDNDKELEVVIGSHNHIVYALNGEDGSLLWTFSTGGSIGSSPALFGIEGREDLIAIGSDDSLLYALNIGSGTMARRVVACGQFDSSPAVGDFDGDGSADFVLGNNDGSVYAEGSGFSWNFRTESDVRSSPAIVDIDRNGDMEVIFGSNGGSIWALNSDGSFLWNYQTGGAVVSSPASGDIDGDDEYEIVVGSSDSSLYVIKGDGSLLWTFSTGDGIESSPAIADIDNDGRAEIVVGSNDCNIYVIGSEASRGRYWVGILLGVLVVGIFLIARLLRKK